VYKAGRVLKNKVEPKPIQNRVDLNLSSFKIKINTGVTAQDIDEIKALLSFPFE
jgi:hypothetical protein